MICSRCSRSSITCFSNHNCSRYGKRGLAAGPGTFVCKRLRRCGSQLKVALLARLPGSTGQVHPWLSLTRINAEGLSDLYRVIPSYTIEGCPGISHYKNLFLASKTTLLSRLIPGYPGISHLSGYPHISRDMAGCSFSRWFNLKLERPAAG